MKIQAKSSRRTIPPHPDVVRLVQDLLTIPKNELAAFIQAIPHWSWPRSELHVWFSVLDRFDEIMESLISDYDADNLQVKPFSEPDKALLFQILRFERMLLDNSTNRKLFNSYDRLSVFVMSPDLDIAVEALSLILRPAHQYTLQISLNVVLKVNHSHLEFLARPWPFLREYNTNYLKLISPHEEIVLPPEASDLQFQWYSPKTAVGDHGPHHVNLKSLATDSRDTITILQEAIDGRPISTHDRFDLMCRIRVAKSLAQDQISTRSKLLTLRLLAIAVYCHTHTETSGQNARLLLEPDLVSHTAPLLAIDKGIPEQVQAVAVHALDGICHHRFRAGEVLTAVNASVAHGLLMSLFRNTVSKLDEPSSEPYPPLFEALLNFLDFLTTHEVSYNMVISAGLIEHLRKIIANRQPSRSIMVARTIPLLENALYGPPQGPSSGGQRSNNPFASFMSDNGIQFLLERIKFEVDSDIAEYQDDSTVATPLGYGKVPTPKINVLKHLLRTIQRMLQSTGSAEVLRLLPEPDSSFIPTLKSILDNRGLFGSTILAAATLVIATWVHNEPSSLAIIQESKLPESFYRTIEQGIEPMIEVIHGMLNAMGALSLNQGGQTLLQARSNVIPTFFGIFTSELHVTPLQEKSNASLIGGDVDELVRHHPWLRTAIFKGIIDVLDKIEAMATDYQPKEGIEGHFNLVAMDNQRREITETPMTEADQTTNNDGSVAKSEPSTPNGFDLHEMPLYQYLNNFFKFLTGFFNHAQHCREILTETDILVRVDRILVLSCWPIEFPMARNLEAILSVNRRLMDASPSLVLRHRVDCVKTLMETNQTFSDSQGSNTRIVQYVTVIENDLENAQTIFSGMRKLLLHLILLNDVYSHSSSHSIHQPFRREPINMLEPLVENQSFIPHIGRLFTASAWEILHLRALTKEAVPQEQVRPDNGASTSTAPAPPVPSQPEETIAASGEHPFAEFLPRKRLLAPQDGKGRILTPEERNHVNIKSVLHAFSNVLQSTFSGIAKALSMPRRLPASETTKFKENAQSVTKILAKTLVDGLRSYHASDDSVIVMGFCALAISSTSCIGPESRHGQNMQTGLFLEFEKCGGVDAVIDVCTYCADLIDRYAETPSDARSHRDKQIMGIAHYFLRHPMIWFYHLASGKPLVESPQTLEIIRMKSFENFDPPDCIIRLRLQLLPIFRRFWEAKWLPEASESVRKAVIFGLLAILKGEYEDTQRLPHSLAAPSGHSFLRRPPPPPISAASLRQLTDMGFPEAAARSALTRARGDLNVATEFLLANAHLFDAEDNNPDTNPGENNAGVEPMDAEPAAEASNTQNDENSGEQENQNPPSAVETVSNEETPSDPPRDYAKELASAREELKKTIVPNALRLVDSNPSFIDDIRDIFIGPGMNNNAKYLVDDIKKFSDGKGDVPEIPEIPLHVRCRILALAYLKVGAKGLGLTSDDSSELLQSLLALLLSGPVPGTATDPNIPKWLASHMLLSDRILCSSEDITAASVPKEGEEIVKPELYVGPAFTDPRKVLFDFCMRLACIPDLQKEDLLSLLGVLAFLTRDHSIVTEFIKRDGLNLLLRYFKDSRQQEDVAAVSMGIFRHVMEDRSTVEHIMRQDMKRWHAAPRSRPGESIPNFLRSMQHSALRDPDLFVEVTTDLCELTEPHPLNSGYRIRLKETAQDPPVEVAANDTAEMLPVNIKAETSSGFATIVIHHLLSEMLAPYRQNTDPGPSNPPAQNVSDSGGTSGSHTPSLNAEATLQIPQFTGVPGSNARGIEYPQFIQNVLTELLLSYDTCKTAFLSYSPKKPLTTPSKDGPKFKPSVLGVILQQIINFKGDPAEWPKRLSKVNSFHSMIVALCADASPITDLQSVTPAVVNVRKIVLENILKAMKEAPSTAETADQRYGRYVALADLCQKLLTTNPHATSQKSQEESLLHISKLMLDKNYVSILSNIISDVDLLHPASSTVISAVLAPLETLTKVSVKVGRVIDKNEGDLPLDGEIVNFSSEGEEDDGMTDTEETPDPYSTSALGMYGGEADGAFAAVEEPLEDEEEDEMEMVYDEGEYGSDESQEDDDPAAIDVESAGDVDIHDDEDTDPEDEDLLAEDDHDHENDEDEEEEQSGSEDDEGLSDSPDEPTGETDDGIWQDLEAPRDGSGDLLQPGEDDDDDDDDDGEDVVEVLDPRLEDTLDDLAYALDGEDLGGPPVFVQAPRPIGDHLDVLGGGNRILDLFVDGRGPTGHDFTALDATVPFDTLPDEFGRAGHRRTFRAPHIIRTSMLQEMLGGPTAQMLQDMARTQNGDIHLAFSGPAAQLLFHEAGFDPSQFRHRMMSRYMSIRPGRSPGSRDGGIGPSMSTTHRWSEEGRVNAGPSFDERLNELANHVVISLLPAARESARIAEETAKREREAKEAEEKEKAEKEALEKAEAEEKARKEAEEELARQMAVGKATTSNEETIMEEAAPESSDNANQVIEPPPSSTEASPPAESTSNERPRVTVMYRGESVDITDADIDPEFLNAVPEDIRDEILGNFVREQQRQSRPSRAPEVDIDMDFFNALPPELRDDVLRGQAIAHIAGAVDMDPASVLATLPEDLRQTVLLEQDDAVLEAMPSSVLAEANALRAQRMARRVVSLTPSGSHPNPSSLHITRKQQSREAAQLLDKSGLAHLLRLLFYVDQARRSTLQQVLVNLSENTKSRADLLNLLLGLLNVGKTDLASVDKSFSQLSVRRHRSNSKGKHKEDQDVPGSLSDRVPDDHVVIQRTLDTLTSIVHTNESASLFFLTEQDSPSGLHRIPSKKGKGKERQHSATYYPFVQLLSLLERQTMVQQSHSLDAISGLLCTVTKPLVVLREPAKSPQQPEPAASTSGVDSNTNPTATTTEEASSGDRQETTADVAQSQPITGDAPLPVEGGDEPKPSVPSREDIIRAKPPQFPEQSLRLIVNLLTMGECSSKCFQNTQALIFNLSSLPDVRNVIIAELKAKAEELGHIILGELDTLHKAVNNNKKPEELPTSITTKFSLPTSSQARLLRILKILETIYMPSLPGRSISALDSQGSDEQVRVIFENLHFEKLWRRLSECLAAVEDRADSTHVATFLLPLMESLMVMCKPSATSAHSAANKAILASASPRSPTLERDSSGDIFISFTDQHRKVLNLMVRNKPSLMNGSFSLLVNNPRVLDFDNKRSYFVHKLRHRSRTERERESYPTIAINVRRAKVFEDSFQSITRLKDKDLKYGKLNVRFSGEEGVDAGGVTREWFRILAREIFNPNYALFAPCGADRLTYQPNPASGINPDHLRYFKFVGRILGKAIYDQRLLDGHFARSVYRQLLGKPVNYRDLEWSDPSYYNGLRWMLDHSVEAMDLTFSEQNDQLGEMVVVDLKPNGRNIAVTDENKDEYIQLIAEYRLTTSIKDQLQSFLEGFYEIVPKEHIAIFDEKELELLISGTPDIEVEDWRSATEYHGYSASDATIVWWWRALKSFSRADRAKVLSFATGTAKVPLGGFAELQGVDGVQRFSIHKDYGPMDRLPQAHTCFNQIDLPQYSSYEMLRQQLLLAINEGGEGFSFA